jgi:hypothetical protein
LDVGTSLFSFTPSSVVEDPQLERSVLATATDIQEPPVPSQQSVPFSDDANISSIEVNEAPPEIDEILLDELTMFLNEPPQNDIPFAEVLVCLFLIVYLFSNLKLNKFLANLHFVAEFWSPSNI